MTAASAIPVLETGRLVLRPIAQADLDPLAEFYASRHARHYGGPMPRGEVWRQMAAFAGCWVLRGYGPWALELKETGTLAGICGPWWPERFPEPEITWAVFEAHTGRGLAIEAARAALAHAYGTLGWETAVSCIAAENAPSVALARRLGAAHAYDWDAGGEALQVWRHLPPAAFAEGAAA